MSPAPGIARVVPVPPPARPPAAAHAAPTPRPVGRLAARLGQRWLPRVAWSIERTGRPGLLGIALLLAAAVFLVSTHLRVAAEVEALRAGLADAQRQARTAGPRRAADPVATLPVLPASTELPAMLRQLFRNATQARLAVDTGRYEIRTTKSSGVVRYQVAFPVTGPYPQLREFLDTTLATMPQVALSGLLLERKTIAEGEVEAQIRMTFYTAAGAAAGAAAAARGGARPGAERVVPPRHAAALFAQHSWTVLKTVAVPPPPPPPPPPDPTAPPLPYALVGSVAPAGGQPVFFLSRGDRMISAHVGDKLDGVYQLESATNGQLVFVYLPLNVRQNIPAGVSP